jgi:hypothetical protein
VAIERTVVCDELECAGSFDRIDEVTGLAALLGPGDCQYEHAVAGLPHDPGPDSFTELSVIVDVKTEAEPWRNGLHIGPQLAIYSRARRMWEALPGRVPLFYADGKPKMLADGETQATAQNGRYVPAPCVRQDIAIVVHLLDGKATPYFVNLAEGWDTAQAAYEQMQREQRAKRDLGRPGAWFVPMPGIKVPAVAQLVTEQAVAANYAGGASVAVRRPDGTVDWVPAPAAEAQEQGALDQIDRDAIAAVWQAPDLKHLETTFNIYTQQLGREWTGRIAEAGEARRRQVECPQRQLHKAVGSATVKCACGWVTGVMP